MYQNGSQRSYSQGFGTVNTNYPIIDQRDPTANDVNYPIGQFWLNNQSEDLWYLNNQSNMITGSNPAGALQSNWVLASKDNALSSLSDTNNVNVVFPSSPSSTPPDNIQFIGGTGISVVGNPTNNSITITNTGIVTETNYTAVSSSTYNVLSTDEYISCDSTSNTITLKFPNAPSVPPNYEIYTVKDRTGKASKNNIFITTVGGAVTIDGQTTYTIDSNYAAVNLIFNGTTYEVW